MNPNALNHFGDGSTTAERAYMERPITGGTHWHFSLENFGAALRRAKQAEAAVDGLRQRAEAAEQRVKAIQTECTRIVQNAWRPGGSLGWVIGDWGMDQLRAAGRGEEIK